jgi:hypothetical protein
MIYLALFLGSLIGGTTAGIAIQCKWCPKIKKWIDENGDDFGEIYKKNEQAIEHHTRAENHRRFMARYSYN